MLAPRVEAYALARGWKRCGWPRSFQLHGPEPYGGEWRCNSVPRPRYRQDPLPLGAEAPAPELFGPQQPLPAAMQVAEQGQLDVMPLGPFFDRERARDGDEERP